MCPTVCPTVCPTSPGAGQVIHEHPRKEDRYRLSLLVMLYSALEERYVPALMSPTTTHVPSSKYVAREGCGVAVGRGVGVGGVGSATIRLKQRQDPTVPPLSVTALWLCSLGLPAIHSSTYEKHKSIECKLRDL